MDETLVDKMNQNVVHVTLWRLTPFAEEVLRRLEMSEEEWEAEKEREAEG